MIIVIKIVLIFKTTACACSWHKYHEKLLVKQKDADECVASVFELRTTNSRSSLTRATATAVADVAAAVAAAAVSRA